DGAMEALARAAELVASGDADRMIVVAADDAGPAAHDLLRLAGWEGRPFARGGVAALLSADASGEGARDVPLDLSVTHDGGGPIGHLALTAWLGAGGAGHWR